MKKRSARSQQRRAQQRRVTASIQKDQEIRANTRGYDEAAWIDPAAVEVMMNLLRKRYGTR